VRSLARYVTFAAHLPRCVQLYAYPPGTMEARGDPLRYQLAADGDARDEGREGMQTPRQEGTGIAYWQV